VAEGIFLKTREAVELGLLEDFRAGRRTRQQVAELLGVSERTIARRVSKIRRHGVIGIKHGNHGKTPVNRRIETEKERALELARTTYAAFNLSHCFEYLKTQHGVACCYDTFRKWCRGAGLGRRLRRRASKARMLRERMASEGLMLQMDGSHHRWNGKDEWCMVGAIDDATSTMAAARFFPGETTWACFHVLRTVIERYGVPEILYTDCAGWAGGSEKRRGFSQFARACEELGIKLLTTSSPEAKGRIERAWRTCQDRLVPELALAGISGMTDANRYLEQVFLPTYWNARLTVVPRDATTRYRPLAPHQSIDEIVCFKYWRRVVANHTVSLDTKTYRLRPGELGSLRGKEVVAHVTEDGAVSWFYGRQRLSSELCIRPRGRRLGNAS
jgi:transposase